MKAVSKDKQFELKKLKMAKFGLQIEFNIIRESYGVEETVKNKLDLPFCANAELSMALDSLVRNFASVVLCLHEDREISLKCLSISNNGISLQLSEVGEQGEFVIKSPKIDKQPYEAVLDKIENAVYDFLSNENGEHLEELF